jgi:hypothetical protein
MPETVLDALAELVTEVLGEVLGGVVEAVASTSSSSTGGGSRQRPAPAETRALMARALVAMALVDDGRVGVAERQAFARLLTRLGVDADAVGPLVEAAAVPGPQDPGDVVVAALTDLGNRDVRQRVLWALVVLGLCEGGPPSSSVREVWRRARGVVTVDDTLFEGWIEDATRQGEARARRRAR